MYTELTNILPEDRRRALRRDYFVRLITVACSLGVVLVGMTGVFLMPAYVYVHAEANEQRIRLAAIESSLKSGEDVALEARITALSKNTAWLASLKEVSAVSSVVRSALHVPHLGIALTGFTATPAKGTKPGTLLLTGVADTRDRLRAYQLALLAAPFVKAADVPISAYAKDTDISFVITVTLAPTL